MNDQNFIPALGYHWMTGLYDQVIRWTMPEEKFRQQLIRHINVEADEEILEFGYGTGANLLRLYEVHPDARVKGLDIDPKVRELAMHKLEKAGKKVQLDLYDGGRFPYPSESFDKVYSCLVFHQLDRETKMHCLQEIYRVLKPLGSVIISDWGGARSRRMRWAFYTVQLLDGFKTTGDNVNGLMPEFMRDAGFVSVQESSVINTRIGPLSYYKGHK